jgi:hypothetical protein
VMLHRFHDDNGVIHHQPNGQDEAEKR